MIDQGGWRLGSLNDMGLAIGGKIVETWWLRRHGLVVPVG